VVGGSEKEVFKMGSYLRNLIDCKLRSVVSDLDEIEDILETENVNLTKYQKDELVRLKNSIDCLLEVGL